MNETTLKIYPNRERLYQKEQILLDKENISQRNKDLIVLFQNYIFSTGSKELRVTKLSSQIRTMSRWLKLALNVNSDLDKLTKNEVLALVCYINRLNELAEATRSDYRRALKQFYKWFKEEDSRIDGDETERLEAKKLYNYLEKEVSLAYKRKQIDPNTIITDEDICQVIEKGTRSIRDKAFLSTLHETGCRTAEFLNLKVGSILIKDNFAEINVPDGKTGKRVVYVTRSLPYLIRYLDTHPFKNDKNSYLWLSEANFNLNDPLIYMGGQRIIDRCFERANVHKRNNWHWFRHSRATILAPKLSEAMLCRYMGWTIGSKQVNTYVHLCNNQLENVFLSINGMKQKEEEIEKPIKCICGSLNHAKERYCFKCYKPLSVEVAIQDNAQEVKELKMLSNEAIKTMQFFMDMQKNPDLMKKFEEFKKNIFS